jgi:hypothetical protein
MQLICCFYTLLPESEKNEKSDESHSGHCIVIRRAQNIEEESEEKLVLSNKAKGLRKWCAMMRISLWGTLSRAAGAILAGTGAYQVI